MCRSIKVLRRPQGLAAEDEVRAAALQFVRKISGYRVPARASETAFAAAVTGVTRASLRLLETLAERARTGRQALTMPATAAFCSQCGAQLLAGPPVTCPSCPDRAPSKALSPRSNLSLLSASRQASV